MEGTRLRGSSPGSPECDRHRLPPAVAARAGEVDDGIEGAGDEVDELELDDRSESDIGGSDGGPDETFFGERSLQDALRSESVQESFGDLECAAIAADVLAHQEDGFVRLHLLPEAPGDRLQERELRHLSSTRG